MTRVLKPFILRRLKAEVERGLPAKKELSVYCKMTRSQKVTYQAVLKNNVEVSTQDTCAAAKFRVSLGLTIRALYPCRC